MLRLKGLDHVGLKVTDLDKSLEFYRRLGLAVVRTSGNTEGERFAVLQVGSQELNIFSHPELVSARTEQSAGMDHFCFTVDAASVEDVMADLRQAGIQIVKGPEKRRDGVALFVQDPDAARVELQLKSSTAA
jgi:lactoylglutathione lyase